VMRCLSLLSCISAVLALAATATATAFGQTKLPAESIGGPFTGARVVGAPFTAEATTSVQAILGDGTRLDQTTTDRYYRDSAGRVRAEKWIGLPAPTIVSERKIRTVVDAERFGAVYLMDAQTRSKYLFPRSFIGRATGGGRWFDVYIGGVQFVSFRRAGDLLSVDPDAFVDVRAESLGNRRIAGVDTTGRRITIITPAGYRGNDKPSEIIDERWESAELKLLVQSRHSDSRSSIEYRLSKIHRDEPPAHLFEIPPDYTDGYPGPPNDRRGMSYVRPENFRADRHR